MDNEHVQLLNGDHRTVCKYKSKSDPNYITVRNAFVAAIEELMGDVLKVPANEKNDHNKDLSSYLNIVGNIEDFLATLEESKTPGSCEWALKEPKFLAWRDSVQQGLQLYYLTGPPGARKSILATHITRHLQDIGCHCYYYFFRQGRKAQQTVAGCLRSFIYQMAIQNPQIRACLNSLKSRGLIFNKVPQSSSLI